MSFHRLTIKELSSKLSIWLTSSLLGQGSSFLLNNLNHLPCCKQEVISYSSCKEYLVLEEYSKTHRDESRFSRLQNSLWGAASYLPSLAIATSSSVGPASNQLQASPKQRSEASSHSFCGSGVQENLDWVLCLESLQPTTQVSVGLHSHLKTQLGKILLPSSFRFLVGCISWGS